MSEDGTIARAVKTLDRSEFTLLYRTALIIAVGIIGFFLERLYDEVARFSDLAPTLIAQQQAAGDHFAKIDVTQQRQADLLQQLAMSDAAKSQAIVGLQRQIDQNHAESATGFDNLNRQIEQLGGRLSAMWSSLSRTPPAQLPKD
jgi:hypothetical protein